MQTDLKDQQSTTPQTKQSIASSVPESWVKLLMVRFTSLYGARFTSTIQKPEQSADWQAAWKVGLDGLRAEQIKNALTICTQKHEWPPSPAEFRSLCIPSIDYEKLFTDAANGKLTDRLTYWSAQSFGLFELRRLSYPAAKEKWRKIVDTMASESTLPNVPEPRAALPAPGQTMSREVAQEEIKKLKENNTIKGDFSDSPHAIDMRLWAKMPKSQKAVDLAISGEMHDELAEARDAGYVVGDNKWVEPSRRIKK